MKEFYQHIVLVAGNHDYYLLRPKDYSFDSQTRINLMKDFCRDNEINYLDGNTVAIGSLTFGGCCMSWDSSYARSLKPSITDDDILILWKESMNDHRNIYQNMGHMNPFHFFDREMNKLKSITDVDIMVTHYGPKVPYCLQEKHKNLISTFYFFDGYDEIRRLSPKVWIHGHTHDKVNEKVYECDILCNPLGYPNEKTRAVIETIKLN